MRRTALILFLTCGLAFGNQKPKTIFDKGNALYRQEKYAEAAQAYESIVSAHMQSPELYFNLGNAYYKLNKVGPAVYNYEKALLLDPGNPKIKNNLQFAHKMMIDEVREVPKAGFRKIIGDFASVWSVTGWAWLAVAGSVLFFASFCGYYFSRRALNKRLFFIGMFVCACVILVAVLSALWRRGEQRSERPAIVFDGIASVKAEPRESAADATLLHEGTKVYVQESLDQWKHVTLPDGSDGWMRASSVKEIRP